MKHLRTIMLVLIPSLLLGAWLLSDRLLERSSPDLGATVVVTGEVVADTRGSTATTTTTMTTTTAAGDTTGPVETTTTRDAASVVDVPGQPSGTVPAMPRGAEASTLYPTCAAGNNGDIEGEDDDVDDLDDQLGDRLDDLCDD